MFLLSEALELKYGSNPEFSKSPGVTTKDGLLVDWNPLIGPRPTDSELKSLIEEYERVETIKTKISKLETIPRAIREAFVGSGSATSALKEEDAAIELERAKL